MMGRDLTPAEVLQREMRHLKDRLGNMPFSAGVDYETRKVLSDLVAALGRFADDLVAGGERGGEAPKPDYKHVINTELWDAK